MLNPFYLVIAGRRRSYAFLFFQDILFYSSFLCKFPILFSKFQFIQEFLSSLQNSYSFKNFYFLPVFIVQLLFLTISFLFLFFFPNSYSTHIKKNSYFLCNLLFFFRNSYMLCKLSIFSGILIFLAKLRFFSPGIPIFLAKYLFFQYSHFPCQIHILSAITPMLFLYSWKCLYFEHFTNGHFLTNCHFFLCDLRINSAHICDIFNIF